MQLAYPEIVSRMGLYMSAGTAPEKHGSGLWQAIDRKGGNPVIKLMKKCVQLCMKCKMAYQRALPMNTLGPNAGCRFI